MSTILPQKQIALLLTPGQRAYTLRVNARLPWRVIANRLGISTSGAEYVAKKYQRDNELPSMPPMLTMGEMVHNLRKEGFTFGQIIEELNYNPDRQKSNRIVGIRSIYYHFLKRKGYDTKL